MLHKQHWNLLSEGQYDVVKKFKRNWTFLVTKKQEESTSPGNRRNLLEAT
jgi:hypothetical protein